jgi:hypothetical protein
LNKSKKLIKSIENISSIIEVKKTKKELLKDKKIKIKGKVKSKEKTKKIKTKKTARTLWVRRKKN